MSRIIVELKPLQIRILGVNAGYYDTLKQEDGSFRIGP